MFYKNEKNEIFDKIGIDYRVSNGLQTLDGLTEITQSEADDILRGSVSIEDLRTQKLSELSAKCHEVICAGFITDVLGFDVHYRSNENDQLKFNLAANNANGGYVWESEALTNHTQAQGKKLLAAFVQHFNAVNLHYAELFKSTKEAATNEAIEAIAWGNSDIQRYPSA